MQVPFRARRSLVAAGVLVLLAMGIAPACSDDSEDSQSPSDDGAAGGGAAGSPTNGGGTGGSTETGGEPSTGGKQGSGGEAGAGDDGTAGEGAMGGAGASGEGGTDQGGDGGSGTPGGRGGTGAAGMAGAGRDNCECVRGSCTSTGCVCDAGFAGVRCDECVAGRFGTSCSPCACVNGFCDDGIRGTGACSCEFGWFGTSCNARPESCRALVNQFPRTTSGTYVIDPDGTGIIVPFEAYCDMTFEGGGWTLIMASNGLGPSNQRPGVVAPSSGTYMPVSTTLTLAAEGISSQVHIRSAGQAPFASITSAAESIPIQNLRLGLIVNANSGIDSPDDAVVDWTGPYARATLLWHSCQVPPYGNAGVYPDIWWSCNNYGGMHLFDGVSSWNANSAENHAMEVYVR